MSETWLRPNRRALALGACVPAVIAAAGLAIAAAPAAPLPLRIGGGAALAAGAAVLVALAVHAALPRLAYRDGRLTVRLHVVRATAVPIEIVEGFLLGQAPTMLPGRLSRTAAAALIVRLAESAADWAQRPVKPALGAWCGGYITIRGVWCEPLSIRLVERLNARLHAVTAARRAGVDA